MNAIILAPPLFILSALGHVEVVNPHGPTGRARRCQRTFVFRYSLSFVQKLILSFFLSTGAPLHLQNNANFSLVHAKGAAVFLASVAARFITGKELVVDGGYCQV